MDTRYYMYCTGATLLLLLVETPNPQSKFVTLNKPCALSLPRVAVTQRSPPHRRLRCINSSGFRVGFRAFRVEGSISPAIPRRT